MAAHHESWSLAVVGQALIRRDIRPHLTREACAEVIAHLEAADVRFTNLETAILGAYGGWPTKIDSLTKSGPEVLDCLRAMSFNAVSLANNHIFDLGPGGILSAIDETRERQFLFAGVGRDRTEAALPGIRRLGDRKVALIAIDCGSRRDSYFALDADDRVPSRPGVNYLRLSGEHAAWRMDEDDWNLHAAMIRQAGQQTDRVIVYLHNHYWERPEEKTSDWVRRFAAGCIDLGACAVVMHGVPLLHGMEVYKRRPIFYGLGNFIFHSGKARMWQERMGNKPWESLIARCEFDGNNDLTAVRLTPLCVGGSIEEAETRAYTHLDAPRLATGSQAEAILERFSELSSVFGTRIVSDRHAAHVVV